MKRLVLAMVVLGFGAVMNFAQAQEVKEKGGYELFEANFSRLSSFLDLSAYQASKVYDINEMFIRQQKEVLAKGGEAQEEQFRNVILNNLKQMKEVLRQEQYRKYVTLLNVTNNNRRVGSCNDTDTPFAENRRQSQD